MQFLPDSSQPPALDMRASTATAGQTGACLPARHPWPEDMLEAFCMRMASHGMCVSRALMQHDRQYGLEQLAHAHNMADDRLREMAVQLFQCFLSRQSGISSTH